MTQAKRKLKWIDTKSILFKIMIPVGILMIVQMLVIVIAVIYGPTFKTFNERTVQSFQSRLDTQKAYIESTMLHRWSAISSDYTSISRKIETYLSENEISVEDSLQSDEYSVEIIDLISEDIYLLIRKNSVNGAFFIMNNPTSDKYGLYLRDYSPDTNSYDNGDVQIEVCPVEVKKNLNQYHFDTGIYFETQFHLDDNEDSFYERTLESGKSIFSNDVSGLGYWESHFTVHGVDAISYQIPVKIGEETIGILGITVDKSFFIEKLLYEVEDIQNLCLLHHTSDYSEIVLDNLEDDALDRNFINSYHESEYAGLYQIENSNSDNDVFVTSSIRLYSSNAYYSNETWEIIAVNDYETLFRSRMDILRYLLQIIFVCLLVGLLFVMTIAHVIARPIVNSAKFISKGSILDLRLTGTQELDLLIQSLKSNVKKVYELPMRLSRILELAHVEMAVFEYLPDSHTISVTDKFYEILGVENNKQEITVDEFKGLMHSLNKENIINENQTETFYLTEQKRWIRIQYLNETDQYSGVIRDVTTAMLERQSIERERDYDMLTGLLNRRGFRYAIDRLWDEEGVALMLMMDLDNLKYINDKYGHDFGDDYINVVATEIKKFNSNKVLTCHMSGDEFVIYVHGYDTEQQVRELMEEFNKQIRLAYVDLFGDKFYAKMSCGLAFKEDGDDYELLMKKAEFAMYEVKESKKNSYEYFSQERFISNEHHVGVINRFNNMISSRNVSYAFQPIINIKTAEVLGYEALMRPNVEEFSSPLKVIDLARQVGRLKDIELITFIGAMESFEKERKDTSSLLFINSLSNQMISSDQFMKLKNQHTDLIQNVVIEICEEESQNKTIMDGKLNMIKYAGMGLAIDDYGTGYNNLATVLDYNAKYLKIEGSLIRNINQDKKKYTLTKGIIEYCKQYNIYVIAEAVETFEELQTVYELGADFVQGYLVQKPAFEISEISASVIDMIHQLNG